MTNDLYGNFRGLMRGLSGFMPQDDPDVKLLRIQSETEDLKNQETEIYAEIGKQALLKGSAQFPELEGRLRLVQTNLARVQSNLETAQAERSAKELEKQQEEAQSTCAVCGHRNPDGVKFCQECGAKLGPAVCISCGAQLAPGTRFCGECGAKQEG